jgi:hypothetical protein
MVVTSPPPGMIAVGGYRFIMHDLQDTISSVESTATLAALPDVLTGYRLAGSCTDHAVMRAALTERGANPLLVDAFRPGSDPSRHTDVSLAPHFTNP